MSESKSFESLEVFELGLNLVVMVYELTRAFPREETYGLVSQMRRASISVISNIAEGQGRLTNGEWRQFLGQARGSLFEIQAQTIVASRLGYLDTSTYKRVRNSLTRVAKPLAGLIDYVRRRETRRQPTTDNRQRE